MLIFYNAFLLALMLLVERRFKLTEMVFPKESQIHVIQAPTPRPKILIQTVYKAVPPTRVVGVNPRFSPNSSSSNSEVHPCLHHRSTINKNDRIGIREGCLEDLKDPRYIHHEEYHTYLMAPYFPIWDRNPPRDESTALVVYEEESHPPYGHIDWHLILWSSFGALVVILASIGLLFYKAKEKTSQLRELYIAGFNKYPLAFRWITRCRHKQNRTDRYLKDLENQNKALEEEVRKQRLQRRLDSNQIYKLESELEFQEEYWKKKISSLQRKFEEQEQRVSHVVQHYEVAIGILESDPSVLERAEKEANAAHELFVEAMRKRGPPLASIRKMMEAAREYSRERSRKQADNKAKGIKIARGEKKRDEARSLVILARNMVS